MVIRVQPVDFVLQDEIDAMAGLATDVGALVTFTGIVRQDESGDLIALEIEHYPGMSENALAKLEQQARSRWSLNSVCIIHRYGMLQLGVQIMMVAVSSAHRSDAFSAAEFLMDHLKQNAPFWKNEHHAKGSKWVEQSCVDSERLQRWG